MRSRARFVADDQNYQIDSRMERRLARDSHGVPCLRLGCDYFETSVFYTVARGLDIIHIALEQCVSEYRHLLSESQVAKTAIDRSAEGKRATAMIAFTHATVILVRLRQV